MKLFRHYKDKPYKYVGIAKHSETLEEMVIYETRYENKEGRVWVRPKNMFFESVDLDGKTTPRFQAVTLNIKTVTEIANEHVKIIIPISEKIFGDWDAEWFESNLANHNMFHLALAYIGEQVVGFKLGYGRNKFEFYSWFGAVLPEFRGLGIATELMKTQHTWCLDQGYTKIQTETKNCYPEMLKLNINNGFEIIGTHVSGKGGLKIVMEKKLLHGHYKKDGKIFDGKLYAMTVDDIKKTGAPKLSRPDFIKHYLDIQNEDNAHYPDSEELLSIGSPFAKKFGLNKLGIHHEVLPPGRRTSWPHAESDEEEFVYVIEGHPDVWIDGQLYRLNPGDGVGFPSGTGICHTFINNTNMNVRLLVVGEATKKENKCIYALHPERNNAIKEKGYLWENPPQQKLGDHDGLPDKLREQGKAHRLIPMCRSDSEFVSCGLRFGEMR